MSRNVSDRPVPTPARAYARLLEPLVVGRRTLKNRVVMGAMHTGLEEVEDGPRRMAAFYGERARAGVGLIVTGGFSPNGEGAATEGLGIFDSQSTAASHRAITTAIHRADGLVMLQVLHAGGWARHGAAVAASSLSTPLCPVLPRALDEDGIEQTIVDHVRCAQLARSAGYDGVEILGSGGYLLNGFFAPRTNLRSDRWGGSVGNRARLATDIVCRTRQALGAEFLIGFRLSLIDLVEGGSTWDETVWLAHALKDAGADLLGSTFGWHESRVPTIAGVVPQGAFSGLTARLRTAIDLPIVATNRINTPEHAEALLARGDADLVALARPLLADPEFVQKLSAGQGDRINTCIACNQSCLDRSFDGRVVSCLVNPRACHETEWHIVAAQRPSRIAVVGAGLAGLACAAAAASRGHKVTLYESSDAIGGQFRLAARIPGKEDYRETLRYYERRLQDVGVEVLLNRAPGADEFEPFDHVVVATGVRPRIPQLAGINHPKVVRYDELLAGRCEVGEAIVIIGAGGIAFDVAEYLTHDGAADPASFMVAWGIDPTVSRRGGLNAPPIREPSRRRVHLLQRSAAKAGRGLGRTTGWIKRLLLAHRGVQITTNVECDAVDDGGVAIRVNGEPRRLEADTVVLCVGQESVGELFAALKARGVVVSSIGGARDSSEIDAERALLEGFRLGLDL